MKHLGIPRMKLPRISKRGTEEIGKRIHSIDAFPEMRELVAKLHGMGFRLGILTSNSEANVGAFLKNHNLEVFDFIKSSSKLLGKASVLRRLMKELRIQPREIFSLATNCATSTPRRRLGCILLLSVGATTAVRFCPPLLPII